MRGFHGSQIIGTVAERPEKLDVSSAKHIFASTQVSSRSSLHGGQTRRVGINMNLSDYNSSWKTFLESEKCPPVLGLTPLSDAEADEIRTLVHAHSNAAPARLEERDFGQLADGTIVKQFILRNAKGMTAKIITYGAIISDIEVPDRNGVSGADSQNRYIGGRGGVSGAVVLGRVANRIAGAQFTIDGAEYKVTANDGTNSLDGGRKGFFSVVWQGEMLP